MLGPGRPPKPRMLKILQGNPGRRSLNPREPLPEAFVTPPPPPEYLPQVAKEVWIEVAEQLCRARLLTKLDLKLLEVYCQCYSEFRKASKFIEEHGEMFTVTNTKGQIQVVRENPAVAIRRSCISQMGKIAMQFGLPQSYLSPITQEFLRE